MFWKMIALTIIVWAVATFYGYTLGGFIHIVPVGVLAILIVRRMGKSPNTEFGRWESAAQQRRR
jgi:hypothetical protein